MSDATVFCNQCGQAVNAAASFCTSCGGTLASSTVPAIPSVQTAVSGYGASQYGGFWIRFVAHLIDSAVVNVVLVPVVVLLMGGYFATHRGFGQDPQQPHGSLLDTRPDVSLPK